MEKKKKIELSYGDVTTTIQLNEKEHFLLNKLMMDNRKNKDCVCISLKGLIEDSVCTKSHKQKIKDILSKTDIINFKLLG